MFWENFMKLCKNAHKSPTGVVSELQISRGSVTHWKTGKVPHHATLIKIAEYFGVTTDYLLGKSDVPTVGGQEISGNAIFLDPAKTRMIPVYESVSAGFGAVAQNLIQEYMPIYIHSDSEASETICIRVTGDSMSPNIENGDVIQVRKQTSVDSGSIAVVLVDGEEALVKKVIYGDSFVELHSFNPAYPPLRFEGSDLMRIRVLGLVKNTLKNPRSHKIAAADNGIGKITEDLSPEELREVEQFVAFLKSKR